MPAKIRGAAKSVFKGMSLINCTRPANQTKKQERAIVISPEAEIQFQTTHESERSEEDVISG